VIKRMHAGVARGVLCAVLSALTVPVAALGQPSSPFTFAHDDAGRLLAAVNPDGDTARYNYDLAGNLLSIDRLVSSTTRVLNVVPKQGVAGDTLTVFGTGFSATPASNTVTVGGVASTVTSATKSRLTLTIPAAASTGVVAVTAPGGPAVGTQTVTIGSLAPVVNTVSATVVAPGGTLTITGQRFATDATLNNVTLNGTFLQVTAATATQLTAKLPPAGVASGRIEVATPGGIVTGPAVYVTPSPLVTPANVGPVTSLTVGGASIPVTQVTASQHGLVTFTGQRGQRVLVRASGSVSFIAMTLFSPDGLTVGPESVSLATGSSGRGVLDVVTLPDTGTYTLWFNGGNGGTLTGTMMVQVWSVPADTTAPVVVGGAGVPFTTGTPGQNHALTFSGTAGQRVAVITDQLAYTATPAAYLYLSVRNPDGTNLVAPGSLYANTGSAAGFIDTLTLPTTGTYSLLVDPYLDATGSARVQVISVPADTTGAITVGGAAVPVTTVVGQDARLTFTGAVGQRLSVQATSSTYSACNLRLLRPDGSSEASASCSAPGLIDARTLTVAGTYTLVVDGGTTSAGSTSVRVYPVADTTGTIPADSTTTTVPITTPGQNATRSFTGAAGQRVSIGITDTLTATAPFNWRYSVLLFGPLSQTQSITSVTGGGNPSWIETLTLPAAGTYTIEVDAVRDYTGNVNVRLSTVPTDQATTMTVGGAAKTVTFTTPGQNANITFTGSTGQKLTLISTTATTVPAVKLTVRRPDNSIHAGPYSASPGQVVNLAALTQTGTHTIVVDPQLVGTGSVTLTLAVSPPGALSINERHVAAGSHARRSVRPAVVAPATGRRRPRVATIIRPGVGQSVLEGRVVGLRGQPLRGIRVSIDRHAARTNHRGIFQIRHLVPGQHRMVIDAERFGRGIYEHAVEVQPTTLTRLKSRIWLPRLDKRSIELPEVVGPKGFVAHAKSIPGLEVRLPAGSRLIDRHGKPVRAITITRIPITKTPHPLPENVEVPVYYTIQPSFSRVVAADGSPAKAQVVYPNYNYARRGTRLQFWGYDGTTGWNQIGSGHVTRNQQVVPDKGVGLSRLTGAMAGVGIYRPNGGPNQDGNGGGDPVDLSTGRFSRNNSDLVLADTIPISLTQVHSTAVSQNRSFGFNTAVVYDMFVGNEVPYQTARVYFPSGSSFLFTRTSAGTDAQSAVYEHTETPGAFYKAKLYFRPKNGSYAIGGWELRLRDGMVYEFDNNLGSLIGARDQYGNHVTIPRGPSVRAGNNLSPTIKVIRSPNGRWIAPTYDANDWMTSATDNLGRQVSFTYANNVLATATNPAGGVTTYGYQGIAMKTVTDPRGRVLINNTFDANGRVTRQESADTTGLDFAYTLDAQGKVTETRVTNQRGNVQRHLFNANGNATSVTDAYGTAEARTTTYTRQASGDLVTRATDPLGRNTDLTWNPAGDLTSTTELAGTGNARTTTFVPEPNFGLVTSVTAPGNRTSSATFDNEGRVITATDARGKVTNFQTNEDGQVTRITDSTSLQTNIDYRNGVAVGMTNNAGHPTSMFVDGAGRTRSTRDAEGRTSVVVFDSLDRPTTSADPLGRQTTVAYDAAGMVTSITDPRGKATTYAYDLLDRVTGRTDPLTRTQTTAYDAAGNPVLVTDRRGNKTRRAYNRHNELISVGFGATGTPPSETYTATITLTRDGVGRVTQKADSASGNIDQVWDDFDRLTSETTGQGAVTYGYDAADRRTSMNAPGLAATAYAYDPADRLTSVTRGTQTGTYTWDDAGRLLSRALPGNTSATNTIDTAGRVSAITYRQGTTALGTINYGYDKSGLPIERSGSWARLDLPAALPAGTYDDANQLTARGASTYAYDNDGNLTSDGSTTYTFNNRGQLGSLAGGQTASYAYDASGRRRTLTQGGATTTFTFDGINPVTETDGTTTTSYLSGTDTDEQLTRTEGSTTTSFLRDLQGSPVALADATGAPVTSYTFDPFGGQSTTGAASTNRVGFTGHQRDQSGLIYMRARYYSPSLGRFISEDPSGLAGGDTNLHAYVGNSPLAATDPLGLFPDIGDIANGVGDVLVDVVHPIAMDWLPCYSLGYNIGRGNAGIGDVVGCVPGGGAFRGGVKACKVACKGFARDPSPPGPRPGRPRNDLPSRGDPNGTGVRDNGNGSGQIRDYGPDGRAQTDYDFGHDHGAGDPHAHDWDWTHPTYPRRPGRPINPGEGRRP
jgi:RHS repeat-associated protein